MWEEREIVLYLMDYHTNADIDHSAKYQAIRYGVERSAFIIYVLKKKFKSEVSDSVTEEERENWKRVRYLVDECIEDGYIREEERTHKEETVLEKKGYRIVSDGQFLHLTSKGKKLARKSYFYFKYLPEEFGDIKVVIVTIFGTIVTSPLWLQLKPLVEHMVSYFTK